MRSGSHVAQWVKNPPAKQEMRETCVQSLGQSGRSPGRGQPTPVFMPGEPNGQRSLAGYHSWTHKESDTTESTEHTAHTDLDLSFLLNCVMLGNLHWESQNSMNCDS